MIYWCAWLAKVCAPGTGWQLDAKTGRADAVCVALLLEEYSRAWVQRLSARLLVIPGACAGLTVGAAVIEVFGPMAALVATSTAARRGTAATFILFHASIGTVLQIGYFPLISCAAWAPFLAPIARGASPRPRRRLLGGAAAMVVAWVQLSSPGTALRRSTCHVWPLLPEPPPPVLTVARHLDLAHTWDLFAHPTLLHNRRVRVVGNFAGEGFVDLLPLLRFHDAETMTVAMKMRGSCCCAPMVRWVPVRRKAGWAGNSNRRGFLLRAVRGSQEPRQEPGRRRAAAA